MNSIVLRERNGIAVIGNEELVTAEAGMGKTRLAQVFCQRVYDGGGHVLWGRCTAENLVAYQPAAEALRTALRSVNPEILSSIVDPRPALRLLLPAASVVRRGELTGVYVAQGEAFALKAVRLGADHGAAGIEVLAGLGAQDRVAVDAVRAGLAGARPAGLPATGATGR